MCIIYDNVLLKSNLLIYMYVWYVCIFTYDCTCTVHVQYMYCTCGDHVHVLMVYYKCILDYTCTWWVIHVLTCI